MKKLVISFLLVIFANVLLAKENDTNSTVSKKEKRKAEAEKQYQLLKNMLENKDFVLESYSLQDRYGNRAQVNSTINFVSVDSTEAVIQIGSDYRIGPNGVGGITAKGHITKWELKENQKNKSFILRFIVMTKIGFYELYFNINSTGSADALLTGLSSGRLTFIGKMVPREDSSVYVGQSL